MNKQFPVLAVVGMLAGMATAAAQTYPSHPVTMIVPFAAGGPMDTVARVVADGMRASLGQPVIIENVVGAGGSIGAGRVAHAAPDGFTISYGGWPTHVINGAAYSLSYDVLKDFEPVAMTASAPWLLLAKKDMPGDDLKGLIAWLKANPDKASVGHGGVGSASHSIGVLFQVATGTRFQLVPYRGNAPAMQDLIAGQIDMLFDSPATALPQVRSGRVKVYAVTAKHRLPSAPDIPTADEAGLLRVRCFVLACDLGPEGHAQADHRQAQCRGCHRFGQSDGASTSRRARTGDPSARSAGAGGARSIAKGRDRKMVADHKVGWDTRRPMSTL